MAQSLTYLENGGVFILLCKQSNCGFCKLFVMLTSMRFTVHEKILEWEKIGEFGEMWAIRQYFTHQLFLLAILLATEVTKQLPFNSLNVSYSAYYSTSLPSILLTHTELFMRSLTKVMPINRIDFI